MWCKPRGFSLHWPRSRLGFVELCAKILQIMRNDFKDYAYTFCQLCAHYAHLYRLCITHIWRSTSTLRRYLVYITNMLLSSVPSVINSDVMSLSDWLLLSYLPVFLLQCHPCGSPGVQSTLAPLQWVLHVATQYCDCVTPNLKPCDHVSRPTWTPLASSHCEDTV